MIIGIDLSGLRQTKWHQYVIRFDFGGLTTATTGLIAHHYGPKDRRFLPRLPAIFPGAATLVEKHEAQKKKRLGLEGTVRGREAAGLVQTAPLLSGTECGLWFPDWAGQSARAVCDFKRASQSS